MAAGLLEHDSHLQEFHCFDHVYLLEAHGSSYGVQGYAEQLVAAGLDQERTHLQLLTLPAFHCGKMRLK